MKKYITALYVLMCCWCSAQKPDVIHYISLNSAIYLGQYDGTATAEDLMKHGDFGVGSEEALNSEIVFLDGKLVFHSCNRKSYTVEPATQDPFCCG